MVDAWAMYSNGVPNNDDKNIACVSILPSGVVDRRNFDLSQLKECRGITEKTNIAWVNITLPDVKAMAPVVAIEFGFSRNIVDKIMEADKSEYYDLDSELGMLVPAIRVIGFEIKIFPLLILVRKNLILTIHPHELKRFTRFSRYAEGIMRRFKESQTMTDRLTILLIRILDENNEANFDGLRIIEEEGERFSQYLVDTRGKAEELGEKIHGIKQTLVDYLGGLWASLEVLHSLRYGDADIISDNPKILDKINLLVEDVNRNLALGEHVSEVLASGLGVLQTIYNNQLQMYNNQLQLLNNKLALLAGWLAIAATAVAVPNTLATIFGIGKVADLLPVEVIIFLIAASTAIATYFTYTYVKSRGLIPKSPDKDALSEEEKRQKTH